MLPLTEAMASPAVKLPPFARFSMPLTLPNPVMSSPCMEGFIVTHQPASGRGVLF